MSEEWIIIKLVISELWKNPRWRTKSERSLTSSLTFCEMNEMYLWNAYEETTKNLNVNYLYFKFLKILHFIYIYFAYFKRNAVIINFLVFLGSREGSGSQFSGFYRVTLGSRFSRFCRVPLGPRFSGFCRVPLGSHYGPGSRFSGMHKIRLISF